MKLPWALVGVAYSLLSLLGWGLAHFIGQGYPLLHPEPVFSLDPWVRELVSGSLGLIFALFVVATSRILAVRTAWARQLQAELRPVAVGMSTPMIVGIAILSSCGEELFFRAFLTPLIGVVPQALVFGLLHQVRGPSRWVWACWAAAVGLVLGAMFWVFGSLSGPLLAHALINALNLAYLRDHEPSPLTPTLGGLLDPSSRR